MKNVILFFALVTITMMSSCHKGTPVACLNVPTTGKVGTSLTFKGCSTDAHHEEWDFGDAATATGPTVTHAYNKAGTFTIKLTAYNADKSKSDSKTATITVSQ